MVRWKSEGVRSGLGLLMTIAAGLGSRRPWLPEFVRLYVGDVLWGVMFFQIFRLLWPRLALWRVWLVALAGSELIEFSQLWHAPWLDRIRDTPLGGLLLGHEFLTSDVVSLAIGASAAALTAQITKSVRNERTPVRG